VARDVLDSLDEIANREGVREVFPGFIEHLSEFIESARNLRIRPTEDEAFGELFWLEAFLDWSIETQVKEEVQVTRYRAHELFRVAKKYEWEQDSLLKKSRDVSGPFSPKIKRSRLITFSQFRERDILRRFQSDQAYNQRHRPSSTDSPPPDSDP